MSKKYTVIMSDEMKSVKVLEFSGKEADWDMWSRKFLAIAAIRRYKDVLLKVVKTPAHDFDFSTITDDADREIQKKIVEQNNNAYRDLLLYMKEQTEFNIISQAISTELPDGDASMAWENLKDEFKPETGNKYVKLKGEFYKSSLEDKKTSVTTWIVEQDLKRAHLNKLEKDCVDEEDFMMHILGSLPSEYDEVVLNLQKVAKRQQVDRQEPQRTLEGQAQLDEERSRLDR